MRRLLSATRIVGSLLIGPLLLLPIPWAAAVLGARPNPNGHWHPPYPPIPSLAPYMVYLTMWQHPGRALYAAGIAWLGVLVLTWGLLGRRWVLSLAVSMLSGLLLLGWAGYSALDTSSNYLTYVGGAQIGGQQYELITVSRVGGAMLPPPPALRTVRVRFRTHGSSLGNAPCGTRFRYG